MKTKLTMFWKILGVFLFIALGDFILAKLASRAISQDENLLRAFIDQADLSASLRPEENADGRRDCVFGSVWGIYRYRLCLIGNAKGNGAKNTIFHILYWPPRPFLTLISSNYYFTEPYGAVTLAEVPARKQEEP